MNRDTIRQILTIAALGATITINALANIIPINGVITGDVARSIQYYFLPAGYVFAIWGLIYLLLTVYVVFQALPRQRHNPVLRRVAPWFILSNVANSGWIFFWHYELFGWSMVAMGLLLVSLMACYWLLGIGRFAAPPAERRYVHPAFSVYLGWISVATIANATVLLTSRGWNGWGLAPELWAVLLILIAGVLAIVMRLRQGDTAYALVIVWALVGIAVDQRDTVVVAATAGLTAALVVLALFVSATNRPTLRAA